MPTKLVPLTQAYSVPRGRARILVQIFFLKHKTFFHPPKTYCFCFQFPKGGPSSKGGALEELCSDILFISHLEHGTFLFTERKK